MTDPEGVDTEPKESWVGQILAARYAAIPCRERALKAVTSLEGGQLVSLTLRNILQHHYQVEVGLYSYGSLLNPGMADPFTSIGCYVSIGPNVRRIGAAHPLESLSLHPYWYNAALAMVNEGRDVPRAECHIGHDAWIGANVVILPGCRRIGIGAVVGAGSIVTHDVADFTIVAGNPARTIRERLSADERAKLLALEPWLQPPAIAKDILDRLQRSRE